MSVQVIFFSLCLLHVAIAIQDYCSINTFNNSDNFMHFSKEATFEEFAVVGKFKGLHCCAKGYRSIEWYKDDKLYPWALQVSHLILFPESANQTIYTQSVQQDDAGNYTCVLKNDTVVHTHTIHLKVFDEVPDDPKITYISQDTNVRVGDTLRLFCEAFGGQVDLPDAHSDAYWQKVGLNGTVYDVPPHVQQLKSDREDGQTFGVYLMIPTVERKDFGTYVCIISKPGNTIERSVVVRELVEDTPYHRPNPVPLSKLILLFSALACCVLALALLYLRFGLRVRVHMKDAFGPLEGDEFINAAMNPLSGDVLLLHSPQDQELTVGVLNVELDKYRYKCQTRQMDANVNKWYTLLKDDSDKFHRIVAVFSPTLLDQQWDSDHILHAIKQLQSLGPKLVVVTLKELPKNGAQTKNAEGETLATINRSVPIIQWTRKETDKFWYALRLELPAKRNMNTIDSTTGGAKETRLTDCSCKDNSEDDIV